MANTQYCEIMLAAFAEKLDPDHPLEALTVADRPDPEPREGWAVVELRAGSLNHHDLWSLRGVGLRADRLPMIVGCDAAGIAPDGTEVIAHSVIASDGWRGEETLDPKRTLLSELHQGTFAERVLVPQANLIPKPETMSWETAACLPTAWLTAYRMLFTNSGASPGATVLVQGAGGGVSSALIQLGSAAGFDMWVTSRDPRRAQRALELGAGKVFASGERLPKRVDVVMETVGAATWSHSIKSLDAGGTIVICGATSGDAPKSAELTNIFFRQLKVVGSTMGSRQELQRLIHFVADRDIRPVIDSPVPLAQARDAFARLESGTAFGKIVLTHH